MIKDSNTKLNTCKKQIKNFIQQILGCQCPEEVFTDIQWEKKEQTLEINISNQLLVYIFLKPLKDVNKKHIIDALKVGQKKRDYKHFNRFRLVIPAKQVTEQQKKYNTLIEKIFPHDNKIHLHIVEKKHLKKILKKIHL
ncbi:MAG: hypothetical protein R6V04_13705 [bacterium]